MIATMKTMTYTVAGALCASVALVAATSTPAAALQINTGGQTGAYFDRFCPELKGELDKSAFNYTCEQTEGSRENLRRVTEDPTQIGYAQFDVYALEKEMLGGDTLLTELRTDLGRECVFMVTSNRELKNFGEISTLASAFRFVLPPERSGSAATFEFLRHIDPDGLGTAIDIEYAASTDAALDAALNNPDVITLFVQFPDPNNARFEAINKGGGVFIPVLDRNILRQRIGDDKLYFAQEVEVEKARFTRAREKMVTACTPMVVFTGANNRVSDDTAREDHQDMIDTVRRLPIENLQPKEGFFSSIWHRTKELSAAGIEQTLKATEEARERAGPMLEGLRERAGQASERAGELADEARERAGDYADRARERAGDLIDRGREIYDGTREQLQDQ